MYICYRRHLYFIIILPSSSSAENKMNSNNELDHGHRDITVIFRGRCLGANVRSRGSVAVVWTCEKKANAKSLCVFGEFRSMPTKRPYRRQTGMCCDQLSSGILLRPLLFNVICHCQRYCFLAGVDMLCPCVVKLKPLCKYFFISRLKHLGRSTDVTRTIRTRDH